MSRRCSRCKVVKQDPDFSSKQSGYCKPCFKEYRRERYEPVGDSIGRKRSEDSLWRKKHDSKICSVCREQGSETTLFRNLKRGRCVTCERKSLYRCRKHGLTRKPKCPHCKKERDTRRRERIRTEPLRRELARVILVTGDGSCAECGQRIRHSGVIDRTHVCE